MDINKEFEKLAEEFEKEWHDGHEPQGEHDHYEEEEVDEKFEKEARSYIDAKKKEKEKKDHEKKYGREPFAFSGKKRRHSAHLMAGEESEIDEGAMYSIKNTKTGQKYSVIKFKDDK